MNAPASRGSVAEMALGTDCDATKDADNDLSEAEMAPDGCMVATNDAANGLRVEAMTEGRVCDTVNAAPRG